MTRISGIPQYFQCLDRISPVVLMHICFQDGLQDDIHIVRFDYMRSEKEFKKGIGLHEDLPETTEILEMQQIKILLFKEARG